MPFCNLPENVKLLVKFYYSSNQFLVVSDEIQFGNVAHGTDPNQPNSAQNLDEPNALHLKI